MRAILLASSSRSAARAGWVAVVAAVVVAAACVAPAEPEPAPASDLTGALALTDEVAAASWSPPAAEAAHREVDPSALVAALRDGLTGYDPDLGQLDWTGAAVSLDDGRGFDAVVVPITGARSQRVLAARLDPGAPGFRTVVIDLAIDAATGEPTVIALHEIDGSARAMPADPVDDLIAACSQACITFVQPYCDGVCSDPAGPPSCWYQCMVSSWTNCTVSCVVAWIWVLWQ